MDSLKKLQKEYPKSHQLLQAYLNLNFDGVKVSCPYWINKVDKKIRGPFGGKGLPGQLVLSAKRSAEKRGLKIGSFSKSQLLGFLKKERIGIDCSGFAYNFLNQMDKEKGGNGIADDLFKRKTFPDWNPAWRASVDVLTNKENSRELELKEVKIGDMIRIKGGRHMMVVVDISGKSIIYAHSSKVLTKKEGVHVAEILIRDLNTKLADQKWQEESQNGGNFGKESFSAAKGDSLRRFNWW